MNSVRSNNLILKYQVCKALGRKKCMDYKFLVFGKGS